MIIMTIIYVSAKLLLNIKKINGYLFSMLSAATIQVKVTKINVLYVVFTEHF